MKIFEHINKKDTCLVCCTSEDKPVTLIGVVGTEEDHIIQAKQVHVDCINLFYYPKEKIFVQKLK